MSQPKLFGNFELTTENGEIKMLGAGSFGKTYRGQHRFLNTHVAVKVIRQRYSDDENYKRTFLQEARLVAQLTDPHIVRILDFGEQDGRLYYVMDYCDGGTLKDLAARITESDKLLAIEVARQAARALVCAHRQGIIHRDIKPENIMLAGSGDSGALLVKVIDFGLAQSVANVSGFAEARAQGFHGTPIFASPEQLREEPLDGRSDLFSLGMTLWWLALGGRLPFGTEKETVNERLSPNGYLPMLQETIPPELVHLLTGLLEKDARLRYACAEDFLALVDESFPQQVIPVYGNAAVMPMPDPVRPEQRSGSVEDHYQLLRKITTSGYGAYYEALRCRDGADEKVWLWVFEPESDATESPAWRPLFEQRMAVLQAAQPAGASIPLDYIEFEGGTLAFSLQWHSGAFLGDGYEGRHQFSLGELMDGLERITRAADELMSLGLPMPEFSVESIEWTPGSPDLAPLFPTLVEESPEATGTGQTGTLNPDAIGDLSPAARFVMLVYPLIASRRFPTAALYSTSAYITVPGISEGSNRHLMEWATSESQTHSLSSLLATLLASEGLKEYSMASFGTRGQSMGTAPSGFPGTRNQSRFLTKHGSVDSLGTVGSPNSPATVFATPISVPLSPPPPVPDTQNLPPKQLVGKKRSSLHSSGIIAAAVAAVALGGGLVWHFANREPESPKTGVEAGAVLSPVEDAEKISRQNEMKRLFSRKDRAMELSAGLEGYIARYGTGDPFVAEAQGFLDRLGKDGNKPIKVPGDVATLALAMERAQEGQTIELAPGTHEAQVICKPGVLIKGQSSGNTILRMPATGTSILSVREGKTVYLENLTLTATVKQSDSPPLVSISGGALSAEGCIFKDNGGHGINVALGGKLDLSSCEVTRCDGNGIRLSGGSVGRFTNCDIHHNGLSGVYAAPSGVKLSADNCRFRENTISGIEAEGQAMIVLTRGSCSQNRKTGMDVSGEGTTVEAEGTAFSGNAVAGLSAINGASVVLKACAVEDNKEDGVILKSAASGSEIHNTSFVGNGIIGLVVTGQAAGGGNQAIVVESCKFLDAPGAAIQAIEGASVSVQGQSEFANNSIGLVSASKARIEMTGGVLRFNSSAGQEAFVIQVDGILNHSGVTVEDVK